MSGPVIRAVFLVHGGITLAAALVLAVLPNAIPAAVGIALPEGARLLPFLLAATELGLAVLSFGAARLREPDGVRLIAGSFAVVHASSAVLETVVVVTSGADAVLVGNIVVRLIATAVFVAVFHRVRGSIRR